MTTKSFYKFNRYIPEHVTDGLINVSRAPLELMLDYPDNVSFTSNIWVRYKTVQNG